MPPRKSNRGKRQAAEQTVSPPAKKKQPQRKRNNDSQTGETSGVGDLSPQVFENLVARVSAEVTKALTPLLSGRAQTSQDESPLLEEPILVQDDGQQASHIPTSSTELNRPLSLADTLVSNSLSQLQSSIQGQTTSIDKPGQMFHSVGLSLDACISDKIRTRIINNEFFDFGTLITNDLQKDEKYHFSIVNGKDIQPSLCLEPATKTKRIANIESWMSAFRIFVSVYTRRYPLEAPALMKYGELINDLASRGQNWRFYDENFRFMRQGQPESYPWGTIQWELWLRSQVNTKVTQHSTSLTSSSWVKKPAIPKGYCFRFQKGQECAGCEFKHLCFKCERNHGGYRCNFRPPTKQNQSITSPQYANTRQQQANTRSQPINSGPQHANTNKS